MSVIDSTNSGGGRSSGDHRNLFGDLDALRRVPEGEPVQEGGGDQERTAEEPKYDAMEDSVTP